MPLPFLPIKDLAARHTGLTVEIASCYEQAAAICLNQHHLSPTEFSLEEDGQAQLALVGWSAPDERQQRAWANQTDATEMGAYACALAAVEVTRKLIAVRRAETLTGADYYLAPLGKDADDLEEWLRLEVSGTQLDDGEIEQRLQRKLKQAARGSSNLPALAVVVGFKVRRIMLRRVGEAR